MSTTEIKPAMRTSPFYWRDGYEQKINWSGRKKADETRIVANKEMVAGQSHEVADAPAKPGSMGVRFSTYLLQRGAAGRKRMKAAE